MDHYDKGYNGWEITILGVCTKIGIYGLKGLSFKKHLKIAHYDVSLT